MKGNARNLKYFPIESVKAEIPFFQRPYVWNEDNWKALLNSINDETNRMPFIGSFIFQEIGQNTNIFSVIDGQQRMTTLFVMIKAYLDIFSSKLNSDDAAEIKRIILIRRAGGLAARASYDSRLTPSNFDKPSFKEVMEFDATNGDDPNVALTTDGQITKAYLFFYNSFKDYEDENMFAIGDKILSDSFFFIVIEINEEDDVQKIFDSVNSLGQKLTCADIIKNYLFQKLRSKALNGALKNNVINVYNDNWEDVFYSNNKYKYWIEFKNFGKKESTNLDEFLKDFAIIEGFYVSSMKENGKKVTLEAAYKKKIDGIDTYDNMVIFIEKIKQYADVYYNMITNFNSLNINKISDDLNTTLLILSELEHTTFTPILIKLEAENVANRSDFYKSLQKFILGTLIYGTSTKNFNKVAESLVKKANIDECINYLNETFNQNMLNKHYSFNDFPEGIRQIPEKNNYQATLLLYIVEMIRRNGRENRYAGSFKISEFSLEHIIPQDFSKWSDVPAYDFDSNGEQIEIVDVEKKNILRKWKVYSLGNMTLLTGPLNSSIGNEIFSIKIDGDGSIDGIRAFVGSLSIAQEIVDSYDNDPTWDETKINVRTKNLFEVLNSYYNFTISNVEDKGQIIKD